MKLSNTLPAAVISLILPCAAQAQAPSAVQPGFLSTNCGSRPSPCFVPGGYRQLNGFGVLGLSNTASTAISTLTAGPNSVAYPSGGTAFAGAVTIANQGGGTLYFCPFGGTCSAALGGFAIASGTAQTFNGVLTAATIAASAAATTASISW